MGLFGWLKKAPEIKKAEFVSPATGKIITIYEKQELSAKYQFGQLLLLTECSINIICFIITVQDVRFLHLSQQTLFPTA